MTTSIPPAVYADDKRMTVVGSAVFCVCFTTAMVGLRIYTRTKIIRLCGIDDYLAAAALLAIVACGIAISLMTTHGLGRHIVLLTPEDITEYMKMFYISIVCYNFAILFIKLSFLCQYYRVMVVPRLRKIYAVALVIVGAWSTSQLFISALQCMPVSGFWDKSVKAKCIPNQPQWYVNAAGNIITDVAVFALPMPIFWHLSLPRKQKILLMGIFSLGFFTVAISIVRVQFLNIPTDFTWANVDSSLWSLGEISSAVTCACLPTLRPLLTKVFPGLMSRVNLSSIPSHQTDTQHTQPTRAYSSLPKLRDMEKGIAESGVSSARSSHLRDDRSTTYGLPYRHYTNESSETIFGLASVREDPIVPVKPNFSPLSPRPVCNPSSPIKSYPVRRDGTPF
ncbi:integral membrane protein [Colletotrichum incanum]|uniref:Integral membrane protein n=1 Tax=Colletotrichum incanum TaxID=1573173 RepID=A0A162PZ46_COLIC|nr:integral membrane protein [Colletotrichum incanum]